MLFKNPNLHSLSVKTLKQNITRKVKLVSIALAAILLYSASVYSQTDSSHLDYYQDSTHYFTILKNGNVGVGIGNPQAQLHTTGSVRFGKFKNSTYEDSVLTTDVNGNLKFVVKKGFEWNNEFLEGPREVTFRSDGDSGRAKIKWQYGGLTIATDNNAYRSSQNFILYPNLMSFTLNSIHYSSSAANIIGTATEGHSQLELSATNGIAGTEPAKKYGMVISSEGINILSMKNNAAGDSVLTTDANGNLKFKAIPLSSGSGPDSSWATDSINIWNKNIGNVGIGTIVPTAKFHTLGSMRFESFKNNLQGDSVLTTDVDGNLKFVYMPYGSSGGTGGGGVSYSFMNGVTQSNGNVSLGGQIQDSVKINLSGHQFSINNGADKVWHMSADGNVGIGARASSNYKMNVYGDVNIARRYDSLGRCERLSLGDNSNTDSLFFQRYNASFNATDLRLNIGDDGGTVDRFVVGYTPYLASNFVPAVVMEAGGRMGIGTSDITGPLSVGWTHGSKLSVGASAWAKQDIIVTNWDGTNGDYTDLLVPGANTNSAFIRVNQFGNVGIGTLMPDAQYKLSVNGRIRAKGLRVQSAGWADFVFDPHYKLLSLTELETFVKANRHLPEIPSAEEVMKDGQEVGDMQAKLLQKIEELTLYTIELNKQVKALEEKNKKLEAQQQQTSTLQQQLDELKKLISK